MVVRKRPRESSSGRTNNPPSSGRANRVVVFKRPRESLLREDALTTPPQGGANPPQGGRGQTAMNRPIPEKPRHENTHHLLQKRQR